MDQKRRRWIWILLLLLLLLLLLIGLFRRGPLGRWMQSILGRSPATTVAPVVAPVPPPAPLHPTLPAISHPPVAPVTPVPAPLPKPIPTPLPVVPVPPAPPPVPLPPPIVIPPGQEGMHPERIPKNITIVDCYYNEEVVAPGETFGFDINGSGFTETFQQMIAVDLDGLDLQAINLTLATANQIHGQIEVGPEATTQYNYPVILIHNVPVFKAPDPFGVVRRGEVLDILLTNIDDSGQYGKFKIITNLDDGLFRQFRVTPTTPKLEVSNVASALPFYVNGNISIEPGLSSGHYGLVATLSNHELFRKDPLVDVVRPNVGRTGSIESLKAVDLAHRPGDELEVTMKGSGFLPTESNQLTSRVDEFDIGSGSFSWVSAGRMDIRQPLPETTPVGVYGMTILDRGKVVFQKSSVFAIVPPNWLSGVLLPQPLSPGKSGVVQIKGRAISPDLVKSMQIETDEEGVQVSNIRLQDASTIAADITVAPTVAPGDYLLQISLDGKPKSLPKGSIIKITQ